MTDTIATDLDAVLTKTTTELNNTTSDIVEAAHKRATDFVDHICNNTLVELQRRRDELDNTSERIKKSRTALAHYIAEFATCNREALVLAAEVKRLVDEMASPFKADPPATITDKGNTQ